MDLSRMKPGLKVIDRWYAAEWGVGKVIAVLKTRVKIAFPKQVVTYDRAHLQFLETV